MSLALREVLSHLQARRVRCADRTMERSLAIRKVRTADPTRLIALSVIAIACGPFGILFTLLW